MKKGKLIIFEGIDHVGKSTLIQLVSEKLLGCGIEALIYRFPGKTEGTLGKLVYDIHHKNSKLVNYTVDPFSLQLLHIAAHIDLLNSKILPAVKSGKTVLLDRYWWSTLAYAAGDNLDLSKIKLAVSFEKSITDTIENKILFYVKRKEREKDFTEDKETKIVYCYEKLFKKYRGNKYILNNDRTIDDAVDAVLNVLNN